MKIQTRIWTQNTGTLGCMKPLLTWSSTHRLKKAKSRQGFLKLLPLILIWRIHVCERPGHALTGFKRLCRLCGLMKNCLDYACCGHSSSLIRLRHCRQLTEAQQCPSAAAQSICVICRQHRSALPVAIVPLRDFSRTNQGLIFLFTATLSINCILLGQCLSFQTPPPAFTSHLTLCKQVLMVPGERIMKRPVRAWRGRGVVAAAHGVVFVIA